MTDNGSRSVPVKTPDPGVEAVRAAVTRYSQLYPDLSEPIRMYGAIMEIQQEALEDMECGVEMDRSHVDRKMMLGEPLLAPLEFGIEEGAYRGIAERICGVVRAAAPDGLPDCEALLTWPGMTGDALSNTRGQVLKGELLELEGDWSGHSDVASRILWEAMVPFFRRCGGVLEEKVDHALWQKGYCPICGGRPLMGKFRPDDGLWLLECSLCHTLWNVQRACCPFCTGGAQGALEFLFLEEDRSRRVQYCSGCRRYVKTVDLREGGEDIVLPLEDIATVLLDRAAAGEGLEPPECVFEARPA